MSAAVTRWLTLSIGSIIVLSIGYYEQLDGVSCSVAVLGVHEVAELGADVVARLPLYHGELVVVRPEADVEGSAAS